MLAQNPNDMAIVKNIFSSSEDAVLAKPIETSKPDEQRERDVARNDQIV